MTGAVPATGVVLCRLAEHPQHTAVLGRLATLRDLSHLYGAALASSDDERAAVAAVFAQLVMQQQALIAALDAAGVRLDMRRETQLAPGAPLPLVFRKAGHDVLREEIAAVQQAKADGALTRHGLNVMRRLRVEMQAILASTPDVPTPASGWIPSPRECRQPVADATTVIIAAVPGREGPEPVLACVRVAQLGNMAAAQA